MTSYRITIPRNAPFASHNAALPRPRLPLILEWIIAACERARTRQRLRRLDPHLLRDTGLTPDDVARECAKPFWL